MVIAKDQLKHIIAENDIKNVSDIYPLFKDSLKEMLQELLEAGMEASIGYPKNEKDNLSTPNKRNGRQDRWNLSIPSISWMRSTLKILNPHSYYTSLSRVGV